MKLTYFLVPVIVLLTGYITKINPAKQINGIRGYRTKRSKSSQEMWDKAQLLMSKYLLIIGAVELVVSLITMLVTSSVEDQNTVAMITSILAVIDALGIVAVIILVESELKKS